MKAVNLVVLTGYPHSGKTTIAEFLVKHRFKRLELYEIRQKLFGEWWPLQDDKEREARLFFQFQKSDLLAGGKNVVLDSCAISNIDRLESFFLPKFASTKFKINKYLLYLDTDRKILLKRNLGDKERDKKTFWEILKTVDKYWQNPKTYKGKSVKLLIYKNNNLKDLEKIKTDLTKKLKL